MPDVNYIALRRFENAKGIVAWLLYLELIYLRTYSFSQVKKEFALSREIGC